MIRSTACLLLSLLALSPLSTRSEPAACIAGVEGVCTPYAQVRKGGGTAKSRSRIEIVRLNDTGGSEETRALSFHQVTALQALPDSVVDQVVRFGGGYMFSLKGEALRGGALFAGTFGASAGKSYAHVVRRVNSAFLFELNRSDSDVWIAPHHGARPVVSWPASPQNETNEASRSALHALVLKHLEPRFETGSGTDAVLHFIPEASMAWLLALGLLVVILRRIPVHFRSNGL